MPGAWSDVTMACASRFSTKNDSESTSSSQSNAFPANPLTIPDPTWSVASLQLHENHPPASMEDLQVLAQRSALDIHRMDDATRRQLCQDLGNMLHMIEHVQEKDSISSHSEKDTLTDPVALYDTPRGVVAAPLRDDTTPDPHDDAEEKMAQSVRASFLEPKMRRVGGHQYYEIVTSSLQDGKKQ